MTIYCYEYLPENKTKITITYLEYKSTEIEIYATDRIYRLIEKVGVGLMSDPFRECSSEKITYDANLNPLQSETQLYRNNQPIIHTHHIKTYETINVDNFDNWTKRIEKPWFSQYEIREFSYYK